MPVARDTPSSPLGYLVGACWAAVGIALLWPTARGATAIAHHHFTHGVSLLSLVLIGRYVLSNVMNQSIEAIAAKQRRRDRASLMASLARSLPSSEVVTSLLWASERASGGVGLDALRAGAGIAVLNVPLLFIFGGWQSAGAVLALIALAIPFYRRAGIVARDADVVFRRQRSDLTQRQLELLTNSLELRALGAVEYGADSVVALSTREHRSALKAIRASLGSSLVTEFLGGVSVGLVAMVVGFGLLHGHQQLTPALLAVFASADLIGWIRRYGVAFHQREAVSEAQSVLRARTATAPSHVNDALIVCSHLQTNPQSAPLSLEVGLSERVAIVGPSGCGKTTLVDTWLGLRSPVAGRVHRADVTVGRVTIDSQLLGTSLRENLALSRAFTDHELRQLLSEVGLTLDLDRRLSPDGIGLSTGERARVVLARALLHDVGLVVLDDIAGVLDDESRAKVRAALQARPSLAVIECNVDAPVFIDADRTVVLG